MTKPTKPKTPPVPVAPLPTFEQGLIVGLLMARGSFTGDKHQPRIAIRGNDIDLLNWIKSRIGGTVAGPYNQPNRAPFFAYQISGAALMPVMELIAGWMPSGPQRKKYEAWIEKHRDAFVTMRQNAAKIVSK